MRCSAREERVQRDDMIWADILVIANIFGRSKNAHRAENRNELRGKKEKHKDIS